MPLVARIDDADRRPQAVPPHLRVPVVERSWAQAHLFRALSERGYRDNTSGKFSKSFADVLLPARSHDPGSHGGSIRSASPRGLAARDWRVRRGLPRCSCFGFVAGTHAHRSCHDRAAGTVVRYLRETPLSSAVLSSPPWDAP